MDGEDHHVGWSIPTRYQADYPYSPPWPVMVPTGPQQQNPEQIGQIIPPRDDVEKPLLIFQTGSILLVNATNHTHQRAMMIVLIFGSGREMWVKRFYGAGAKFAQQKFNGRPNSWRVDGF